jgi:hypothetical protein
LHCVGDAAVRLKAVQAMQFCSPEEAELLLTEANDRAGWATCTPRPFSASQASLIERTNRLEPMRHFANVLSPERRRLELEQAADKVLLTAATSTRLRQGAILWVGGRDTRLGHT